MIKFEIIVTFDLSKLLISFTLDFPLFMFVIWLKFSFVYLSAKDELQSEVTKKGSFYSSTQSRNNRGQGVIKHSN